MSHFQLKKIENLFHKSNRYQTKEFNIWLFSICHCILNFKTLRKKKLRTCMFLPVRLSAKKIDLFKKIWFVISSLRNVTFKADSFEIITMVRYLCFSRVSFSLDVLEKILLIFELVYLCDTYSVLYILT